MIKYVFASQLRQGREDKTQCRVYSRAEQVVWWCIWWWTGAETVSVSCAQPPDNILLEWLVGEIAVRGGAANFY